MDNEANVSFDGNKIIYKSGRSISMWNKATIFWYTIVQISECMLKSIEINLLW